MANIKITELNETLTKTNNDVLPIVDITANETKKIKIENLLDKNIELLAVSDTAPIECNTGDKYYNTSTKLIYTATAQDTWSDTGTTPLSGILYIVYADQASYSWDGTDLVSVGGGAGLPSYFSTEIDTGMKWIDGKPIYRKVIPITYSSGSTTASESTGITNINEVVKLQSIVKKYYTSGGGYYDYENGNYTDGTNHGRVVYRTRYNTIEIRTSTTSVDATYYVILEYTKTTD